MILSLLKSIIIVIDFTVGIPLGNDPLKPSLGDIKYKFSGCWYLNDLMVRINSNLPIKINYNLDGIKTYEEWTYRDDELLNITYYDDGTINTKEWKSSLKRYNNDEPCLIKYNDKGKVIIKEWRLKGKIDRNNDKPAIVKYHPNGKVIKEEWFKDNKHHRKFNPAIINYNTKGEIIGRQWFVYGIQKKMIDQL